MGMAGQSWNAATLLTAWSALQGRPVGVLHTS
jgi:hypothetical protein